MRRRRRRRDRVDDAAGDEYDVLITDWMMPGLDGPELCRRVRASKTTGYTYILMATSLSGARATSSRGMEAGADDYLVKPVDPFALQTRLIAAERVTELHDELVAREVGSWRSSRGTDPLTQLNNRLRLHEDLVAVHERRRRSRQPVHASRCATSTGSRRTTTPTATSRATRHCAASAGPSPRRSAPATARTATAARSSSSCCPT